MLPDFHAQQRVVGQHFAHIDDVVLLFHPQTRRTGADSAVDRAGFHVFRAAAQVRRDPLAQYHGRQCKNQAELRQHGKQPFRTHTAGLNHGQFAAGGKLAQGNQAADQHAQRHQFVSAGGHLHQNILRHFRAGVAAFADIAHFVDDFEKAV